MKTEKVGATEERIFLLPESESWTYPDWQPMATNGPDFAAKMSKLIALYKREDGRGEREEGKSAKHSGKMQ